MNSDPLYPLRRLHGLLHEKKILRQRRRQFLEYVTSDRSDATVFLVGTPTHTNLGDSAIVLAQIRFLQRLGIAREQIKEITFDDYYRYRDIVKKSIRPNQFLCFPGGGNMGNQWIREDQLRFSLMEDHPSNPVLMFPQTLYFLPGGASASDKAQSVFFYNRPNVTLFARECSSYTLMQELYPRAKVSLSPDIVLSGTSNDYNVTPQERRGVLLCMRNDAEKLLSVENQAAIEARLDALSLPFRLTDMHASCPITPHTRAQHVREKMLEFARAELVITDRLHGMVFSAITGTPCIALGNYNYKVSGTYEWIKHLPYVRYANSVSEALELIPLLLPMKCCHFDNAPLSPYFDKLAEEIKKQWQKSV